MSEEWFAIEKSAAKAAIVQEVQPLLDRIRQLSDELDLARDCLKRGDERDIQWAQYRKALQDIADGTCLVFDESEEREVEVWMDAEDLQEIARQALGPA